MKLDELRVGNLILHYKQAFVIHSIIRDSDSVLIGGHDISEGLQDVLLDEIEPMPLTDDVFSKIGYTPFVCLWNCFWDDFGTCVYELVGYRSIEGYLWCEPMDRVNSVHRFQNLYFMLTGNELDIKKI